MDDRRQSNFILEVYFNNTTVLTFWKKKSFLSSIFIVQVEKNVIWRHTEICNLRLQFCPHEFWP